MKLTPIQSVEGLLSQESVLYLVLSDKLFQKIISELLKIKSGSISTRHIYSFEYKGKMLFRSKNQSEPIQIFNK